MKILAMGPGHCGDVSAMLRPAGGSFIDAADEVDGLDESKAADWLGRFVAIGAGDQVLGYVAVTPAVGEHHLVDDVVRSKHGGPHAVGDWIFASSRRAGVASDLMRCAIKYLIDRKCAYLVVDVDTDLDDTQDFDQDDGMTTTTFEENAGSIARWAFVESLGMERIGDTRAGGSLTTIETTLGPPSSGLCC